MRGTAAESRRYRDPAVNRKIRARARHPLTEPQARAFSNGERYLRKNGLAVERQFKTRTSHRHGALVVEFEFWPDKRDLEERTIAGVTHERIRQTVGERIHRTSDAHAARLQAPSSEVLNCRQQSGSNDEDGAHKPASTGETG